MRRNRIVALVIALSMLSLNGCMSVGDLTEKQSDFVAEYSAGLLLRYSDRYERRLLTKEQLEKQGIEPTAEVSPTPMVSAEPTATAPEADATNDSGEEPEATAIPNVEMNEIYQLDGIKVRYDSYEFANKYGSSQIRAEDGETLLIVSFEVKNVSGKTKKVNLMKRTGITYTLDVDGHEYQPGISILENGGMNQLLTTLKPGKKEKAVLIYRMDQERKTASSITLSIADGDKQSKLTLK